jgi:23S rRNA (guanosine2251-2'-O)-methyltransferase
MSRQERKKPGNQTAENNEELVIGRQAVLEALRYGSPLQVLLAEGCRGSIIDEIKALAGLKKITTERLARDDFERKTGGIPGSQGTAAIMPPFEYSTLDDLIGRSKTSDEEPFLLMLDHIDDPRNLGAVMRTADAAGVHGLIIPGDRAAGITAAVRKVAAGAAERLPVAKVVNLNNAAEMLKAEGFWLYGAEADGDDYFYKADFMRPIVLVLGSEGRGISRLLRKNCDLIVSIPMPGHSGSLNISAAAAVLIYAALSQRKGWSL